MSYAIIFSGQGQKNINLFKKIILYENHTKYLFDKTSEYINYNIWKNIINNNNEINLKKKFIQPILLTIFVAIYKIWMKYKPKPILSAGNSLGEYIALTCANCIKFSDAIKLLLIRTKYMNECIKQNNSFMTVIKGLNKRIIKKICKFLQKKKNIFISNFNTYKKITITGNQKNILKTIKYCQKINPIKIYNFPIRIISHCKLLKVAAKKLNFTLNKIMLNKPNYKVINNINIKNEKKKNNIKRILIKQLYKPIRWEEIINYIISKKIQNIIEIGSTGINQYFYKNQQQNLLSIRQLYKIIKK